MQVIDQLQRVVQIAQSPVRIISTVPSQTELLYDLGLEENIFGITKFCVHPTHLKKTKTVIGGTKNLHIEEIKKLKPDFILANKEENEQSQIEELVKEFPVWLSDIKNMHDAFDMIKQVGLITNKQQEAENILQNITQEFDTFNLQFNKQFSRKKTLYLIWKDPYMTVGADTFIHSMLEAGGFLNVMEDHKRYPKLSSEEIIQLNPECVLLSSEPYPFKEIHKEELSLLLPAAKILLADGEMFSWYGSRMQYAFRTFAQLHCA